MRSLRRICYNFKVIKKIQPISQSGLQNAVQYFLTDDTQKVLSFWNDLPLSLKDGTVNASIQIPRQKTAKFQVIKSEKYHPFMQDTKKNVFTKQTQLRHYAQFPLFNYGFIPQTWEQNIIKDALGLYGDDDPIDICDLSRNKKQIGDIFQAKILGSFCLIDQQQVDWKVLVVDNHQALQKGIKDLAYYSREQLSAIMGWFKGIKIFDGKKANKIAYDQKIFSKDETLRIIHETHIEWKKLLTSNDPAYNQIRDKYHLKDTKIN